MAKNLHKLEKSEVTYSWSKHEDNDDKANCKHKLLLVIKVRLTKVCAGDVLLLGVVAFQAPKQ
jgi:hypothetical protein